MSLGRSKLIVEAPVLIYCNRIPSLSVLLHHFLLTNFEFISIIEKFAALVFSSWIVEIAASPAVLYILNFDARRVLVIPKSITFIKVLMAVCWCFA